MLKKIFIGIGIFFISIYLLFLILPFVINGIVNSYSDQIAKTVEDYCGFKLKMQNLKVLTTPKLTVGAGVGHLEVAMPSGETFFTVDNIQGKLSLLSILARKIEIDMVGADNINLNLKVKKDGHFLIEDYIPASNLKEQKTSGQSDPVSLPFGIRLSNNLPDIYINNYNISFTDAKTDKSYSIYGDYVNITDFILNKKIKINAVGKIMLQDKVQFNYDVNIFNKVMPDINLHNLVFPQQMAENIEEKTSQVVFINILDVFKAIHDNQLTTDILANINTSGSFDNLKLDGAVNVSNISVAVDGKKLPASNMDFNFKGNGIKMYAKMFSALNDITEVTGNFKTGNKPGIDLNCKSNAQFKGVIDLIDSIAKSFGYKELDSLTASGGIDADFTIKSNMKKVDSSGYLKVLDSSLKYGLLNTSVDNIKADIDFSNSMVNIKNAGLSILGQPLTLHGTISQDAVADMAVVADKLQIKGLLLALGQVALLKENDIKSGVVSLNIDLKGKLDKLVPKISVSVDNVNLKNLPSNTSLILKNLIADIKADLNLFGGDVVAGSIEILYPAASLYIPKVNMNIGQKDILITNSYAIFEGNRIDITGKISDYLSNNLKLDFNAVGPGKAHLKGTISDLYKSQKLNLNLSTSEDVSVPVPNFKGSNIKANANINISGTALSPLLKGYVGIPSLTLPDMLLTMEGLNINLNGPIVKGNGTLKKFVSGGIVANNLSADFDLKNNIFYLNNIKGDAFDGKVAGNISYNIVNGHIGVDFKGLDMNAEKAVTGAAGIKNALSGKLGFNAKVTLHGATDIEMIKNLKGNATFEIVDGELGNIGRFENLILAQNVLSNSIMKAAVTSISSLPAIKNTAQFKSISGNLTFSNGWANLAPVKTTGPSMAYYITGKYNVLNGTANIIVLGRLAAEVVALLGPVGDLSVDKLTSYIPKFGNLTGFLINTMTSDPSKERVDLIPQLSSGETVYKDFKVEFNGGIESKSSVKSFKWLSVCDTTALDALSVKEQIQNTKEALQQVKQQHVDSFNNLIEMQKQQAQEAKQQLQDAKENLKNLKNLFK